MNSHIPISESQAVFTLSLLRQAVMQQAQTSLVMSPFSVSVALAMLCAGARNDTAHQFIQLLAKGINNYN